MKPKIIDGGVAISKEFNDIQLIALRELVSLKIDEMFNNENEGSGIMIFNDVKSIYEYESMYVEFFFNNIKNIYGANKIILYNGDTPDEVLDCISYLQKELKGLKSKAQ